MHTAQALMFVLWLDAGAWCGVLGSDKARCGFLHEWNILVIVWLPLTVMRHCTRTGMSRLLLTVQLVSVKSRGILRNTRDGRDTRPDERNSSSSSPASLWSIRDITVTKSCQTGSHYQFWQADLWVALLAGIYCERCTLNGFFISFCCWNGLIDGGSVPWTWFTSDWRAQIQSTLTCWSYVLFPYHVLQVFHRIDMIIKIALQVQFCLQQFFKRYLINTKWMQ